MKGLQQLDQDQLIYMALLANQAQQWEDMVDIVKHFSLNLQFEPGKEERSIVFNAYKSYVYSQREKISTLQKYQQSQFVSDLILKCANNIANYCNDAISLIDNHLYPIAETLEYRIFLYLSKGDFSRYLAEFTSSDLKAEAIRTSQISYDGAYNLAIQELSANDSTRLNIALNWSILMVDLQNNVKEAWRISNEAYQFAMQEQHKNEESQPILQKLLENIEKWNYIN